MPALHQLTRRAASVAALAALGLGLAMPAALAQDSYKIGISGTATGPASPSYKPHTEGIRLYLRKLNDEGGVNGRKVDVIFLDDKGAPSEAASNAKRLMVDEDVLLMGLMSLSSTYAPMFQTASQTKTPLVLLGQAVCPAEAGSAEKNPYVFCAGSTADPATAAYWQVPLAQALAKRNGEELHLGLVSMDIPISRQGVDNMAKLAKKQGIDVVDNIALPPAAADVSGAAVRLSDKGANYVMSWAPVTTAVQTLGALRRQGWDGWYIHNHSAEAEDTLRQLKDPKLIIAPEYNFTTEDLPVFDEIKAAAEKYGVDIPVDMLTMGWAGGMIVEAALKKCGPDCDSAKMLKTFNGISVDTGGIYPEAIGWSEADHRRAANFTAYAWDEESKSIKRVTNFPKVEAGTPATVEFVD